MNFEEETRFVNEPPVRNHRINGWFETNYPFTVTTAFQGILQESGHGTITGNLDDVHGKSLIQGELREGELTFLKKYQNGPSVDADISYKYFATGNGSWGGMFSFSSEGEVIFEGKTECETEYVPRITNIPDESS